MKVEQLYTGCLSEAAYFIESEGEIAIIDPLRETEPYMELAEKNNAKIKYIFETHFHADFVSGHVDLAKKTGATIVYGPTAETGYDSHIASDGEIFEIGKVKIKVLHTPGHTPESSTYLLYDEDGKEYAIFSGDTVFIGDVGRPDLAISSDLTEMDLAGMLYDSIWNKIMPLPDHVLVYPAHGAGSLCGKNMSSDTYSTLGEQRRTNYALQEMSKEDFVKEVTTGIPAAPQYFPKNAAINKGGYSDIDEVMAKGSVALNAEKFDELRSEGILVLDGRDRNEFAKDHVPGSMNISLDGSFAVWVGTLIEDLSAPILVVAPSGREEEMVLRLARVGYDNCAGYLKGGIATWKEAGKETGQVRTIQADELKAVQENGSLIYDVRKCSEYDAGHVVGVENLPLNNISVWKDQLGNKEQEIFLHCRSGYRSMTAASILKAAGFNNVVNVEGGFVAISKTSIPLEIQVPA